MSSSEQDKINALATIAEKTEQMQKLFEECIELASKHNVKFSAGLTVPKELSPYDEATHVGGRSNPGNPQEDESPYWHWANSSLNC